MKNIPPPNAEWMKKYREWTQEEIKEEIKENPNTDEEQKKELINQTNFKEFVNE